VRRHQLDHVIRAAAVIADDPDVVIFGSQAIHAQALAVPADFPRSNGADIWPLNHTERHTLVDDTIGAGSGFAKEYGYHGRGIDPAAAVLPAGWRLRLVALHSANTAGATGWALEIHDLLIAKLHAGRERDHDFVRVALEDRLADTRMLQRRLATTKMQAADRQRVAACIESLSLG